MATKTYHYHLSFKHKPELFSGIVQWTMLAYPEYLTGAILRFVPDMEGGETYSIGIDCTPLKYRLISKEIRKRWGIKFKGYRYKLEDWYL